VFSYPRLTQESAELAEKLAKEKGDDMQAQNVARGRWVSHRSTGKLHTTLSQCVARFASIICFLMTVISQTATAEEAQQFSPLKIGAILPLTGVTADYGESIKNSIEMAQADHPHSAGSLEFIFEDASYDAKQAVAAFHKLVNVEHVDLVYVWGVAFCKAVAPLAEAHKLPMIGQCIDPEVGRGRAFVLRFMNHTDQYLSATVKYLDKKNYHRLAIVVTENAYLEEMLAALQRTLTPSQSVSVLHRSTATDMDFRTAISRLRSNSYDAVGVFLSSGQIAAFHRQLREQALTIPSFGTNYFESLSEIQSASGSMDGAIFANNEVFAPFIERYRARYGKISQIGFGSLAYEFAVTIGKISSALPAKQRTGAMILAKLETLPPQAGVAAGPYRFKNDTQVGKFAEFPIAIKEVRGADFVVLER